MKPAFHITITADDGVSEIDCRVWAEAADRQVGILEPQFEIEPDVRYPFALTPAEERRAMTAAREWRP